MINTVSRYQDADKAMLTIMAKLTVLPQHDWSSRAPQSRMEWTSFFSASALLKASLNGKYGTFQKENPLMRLIMTTLQTFLFICWTTTQPTSPTNVCLERASVHPGEKSSIYWLGVFWRMAAGLSWSWAGASCLGPAHDQLKSAAMLQNIPYQHLLCF